MLDDGLVLNAVSPVGRYAIDVLILVLLDDGLVHHSAMSAVQIETGLNPCFVGRWTSTRLRQPLTRVLTSCLNPCFVGRWTSTGIDYACQANADEVLILVLLDDGLVR